MEPAHRIPNLSGGRFSATYLLSVPSTEVHAYARELAIEQTVEFPESHIPLGDIADQIVGRVESVEPAGASAHRVTISYADEIAGGELAQLLNIVYGNVALKPAVRLLAVAPSPGLARALPGPRCGISGLRARLGIPRRPILCTAIKPMGLSTQALADQALAYARGGIDLIKDDHGLTDQPFAPFRERVLRTLEALDRAARETGERTAYVANVTASPPVLLERARFAKDAGASALMVAPGIAGLAAIDALARDPTLDLPILAHPSGWGHFAGDPRRGIAHRALFGHLLRLAGADGSIFVTHGGRFPDTPADSREVVEGCRAPFASYAPILPMAGGGVTVPRLEALVDELGSDLSLLVGGGLHTAGPDLVANCRAFRRKVERFA